MLMNTAILRSHVCVRARACVSKSAAFALDGRTDRIGGAALCPFVVVMRSLCVLCFTRDYNWHTHDNLCIRSRIHLY